MGVACLEFRGENFRGWLKIAKFVKVFSLENFPLYGSSKIARYRRECSRLMMIRCILSCYCLLIRLHSKFELLLQVQGLHCTNSTPGVIATSIANTLAIETLINIKLYV